MPAIPAIVVGAAMIGSSIMSSRASSKAAGRAADAARDTARTQAEATLKMFNMSRDDLAPYMREGTQAVKRLDQIDVTGGAQKYIDEMQALEFQFDPEDEIYKWRQEQNERQVNRFFASRGGYDSRAALNALTESGMALQENEVGRQYNQRYLSKFNQLATLYEMARGKGAAEFGAALDIASVGRGAATTASQGALSTGSNLARIYGQQGNALQQAALMKGASAAQMWSGIGQGIATMAGGFGNAFSAGYPTGYINQNAMSQYAANTGTMYANY